VPIFLGFTFRRLTLALGLLQVLLQFADYLALSFLFLFHTFYGLVVSFDLVFDVLDPVVDVVFGFLEVLSHEGRTNQLENRGLLLQQVHLLFNDRVLVELSVQSLPQTDHLLNLLLEAIVCRDFVRKLLLEGGAGAHVDPD